MPEFSEGPRSEQPATPEIALEPGLKAYPLPDIREQNPNVGWEEKLIPSKEEAQTKINALLANIEEQGGELKGIMPVETESPTNDGRGPITETVNYLIVKK